MATRRTLPRKAAATPPSVETVAPAGPEEAIEASPSVGEEDLTATHQESAEVSKQSQSDNANAEPEDADKSVEEAVQPVKESEPRFHFFIIDSGWKSVPAKVIRDNFRMIREFQNQDPLYVLSREQSIALIRANPYLIGKDPIILLHDLHAKGGRGESGYHGFRLCLGAIKKPETALLAMQEFLRFVHNHRRSADIEQNIKEKLHKAGMEGAIEILRSGAHDIVGG